MNLTTILADKNLEENRNSYFTYLNVQKYLAEKYFDWITLKISNNGKVITGKGTLLIGEKENKVELFFSPFFKYRYDRIYIRDNSIKYHDDIHLYRDLSLCLYHPKIDKPLYSTIPLFKLIPRISEWCVHYDAWKKYNVWLGKEIKHRF